MSEETRERSTTTAALWPEAAVSDLNDSNRWVYFMKGTGSDRDMRLALGVLREWLQTHFGDVVATKFEVDGNNVKAVITSNKYLVEHLTQNKKVEVTPDGVVFTDDSDELGGTYSVSITTSGVTVTKGNLSATLSKNGLSVTDGTHTTVLNASKAESNKFKAGSVIASSTDYTGLPKEQMQSGNDEIGDIALVRNTGSASINVNISAPAGASANYVKINAGCCIPFICVSVAEAQYKSEWAPMANVQIY